MRLPNLRRINGLPIIVSKGEVPQMRNCPLFMRTEPKAASKPVFDYGNSATAQRCFCKQAGFSLRRGRVGLFSSFTGDFAPQSARINCGRKSERDENGGQKNGSAQQGSGVRQVVRSGFGAHRGIGAVGASR